MPRADLHLHSNKSDGMLSPGEVVLEASKRNLAAIALTDHDTVDGVTEALRAGDKYNVKVVPGVEINTSVDNGELHILGYYIEHTEEGFVREMQRFKKFRMDRTFAIIKKLNTLGLYITKEQVLSEAKKADALGRPHIARTLIKNGYVSSVKEAFEKYIGQGRPAYVERRRLLPREAIELIKGYGGVPVLAHPGTLSSNLYIELCINEGIQGIEAFHSKHDANKADAFVNIARKHNLIITGGSDCHGEYKYNDDLLMGHTTVDARVIDRLKNMAYNNRMC